MINQETPDTKGNEDVLRRKRLIKSYDE